MLPTRSAPTATRRIGVGERSVCNSRTERLFCVNTFKFLKSIPDGEGELVRGEGNVGGGGGYSLTAMGLTV